MAKKKKKSKRKSSKTFQPYLAVQKTDNFVGDIPIPINGVYKEQPIIKTDSLSIQQVKLVTDTLAPVSYNSGNVGTASETQTNNTTTIWTDTIDADFFMRQVNVTMITESGSITYGRILITIQDGSGVYLWLQAFNWTQGGEQIVIPYDLPIPQGAVIEVKYVRTNLNHVSYIAVRVLGETRTTTK
jgi:hypothetical protein